MSKKPSLFFIILSLVTWLLLLPVQAQDFLPESVRGIFQITGPDATGVTGFFSSRSRTALFFVLAGLVLYGVIQTIRAAADFMRSKGDPGQVEEATKAIKAIYYGIVAMMVGIIGMVVVFVFFNSSLVKPELFQVCLSAPQSEGCEVCQEDGRQDSPSNLCHRCELIYEEISQQRDLTGDGFYKDIEDLANTTRTIDLLCVDPGR